MSSSGNHAQRRVALLAYPQLVLLDLVGPSEVFSIANRPARKARPADGDPYILETLSLYPELHLRAGSGICVTADRCWTDCDASIDTLLIPGGFEMSHVTSDAPLLQWLLEIAPRV